MPKDMKKSQPNPLKCKFCGHNETFVTETRKNRWYTRRTRECSHCGERFNTAEIYVEDFKNLKIARKSAGRLVDAVKSVHGMEV